MNKNFLLGVLLVVTAAVVGTMLFPVDGSSFNLFSRFTAVKEANGEIRLALDEVSDGKARFYSYQDGDKTIKFFVVKSPDGVVRAAFDACDVCFKAKKGYSQEGYLVCINCGRKFHGTQVNVATGGCNPAPLARRTDGAELVILAADIKAGARFF